jgi:polyisoprenoid-binding protein YceI
MSDAIAMSYKIAPSDDSTLAIEISRTGFRKSKKHALSFDSFEGELTFSGGSPEVFKMALTIDARNVACRDSRLKARKRRSFTEFARNALGKDTHRQVRFTSTSLRAKPLRGFVIEGVLQVGGITRVVKVNAVFSVRGNDLLQIDGDTTFRLTDFDLPRRSWLFGLFTTKDEVEVRLLLWATPSMKTVQASA